MLLQRLAGCIQEARQSEPLDDIRSGRLDGPCLHGLLGTPGPPGAPAALLGRGSLAHHHHGLVRVGLLSGVLRPGLRDPGGVHCAPDGRRPGPCHDERRARGGLASSPRGRLCREQQVVGHRRELLLPAPGDSLSLREYRRRHGVRAVGDGEDPARRVGGAGLGGEAFGRPRVAQGLLRRRDRARPRLEGHERPRGPPVVPAEAWAVPHGDRSGGPAAR
mmetsp:Transcript_47914/g.147907  ORF Transcript_47914/g.147907 Transcript_47914/m.147907 type:complete len:219 (+) Transcript_47914:344-1000(+)